LPRAVFFGRFFWRFAYGATMQRPREPCENAGRRPMCRDVMINGTMAFFEENICVIRIDVPNRQNAPKTSAFPAKNIMDNIAGNDFACRPVERRKKIIDGGARNHTGLRRF
tara:strand:- start:1023 stop:1355 length:333 start_codon:yes stop_codon:yes gene_type:complete